MSYWCAGLSHLCTNVPGYHQRLVIGHTQNLRQGFLHPQSCWITLRCYTHTLSMNTLRSSEQERDTKQANYRDKCEKQIREKERPEQREQKMGRDKQQMASDQ